MFFAMANLPCCMTDCIIFSFSCWLITNKFTTFSKLYLSLSTHHPIYVDWLWKRVGNYPLLLFSKINGGARLAIFFWGMQDLKKRKNRNK
jgi:hypothetical protein